MLTAPTVFTATDVVAIAVPAELVIELPVMSKGRASTEGGFRHSTQLSQDAEAGEFALFGLLR